MFEIGRRKTVEELVVGDVVFSTHHEQCVVLRLEPNGEKVNVRLMNLETGECFTRSWKRTTSRWINSYTQYG